MRLSTGTYAFAEKYGDFKAVEKLKAWGFDCVDYGYFKVNGGIPALQGDHVEYAEKLRTHLDGVGLACNQAHAPNVSGTVWDESNPSFALVVRAMQSAAILGAEHIIVHPQALHPFEERKIGIVEYNERFYTALLPYCKRFGIKIGVENLFTYDNTFLAHKPTLGRPEQINALLKKLDERYFGFCLDTGHTVFAQYCPEDFIAEIDEGAIKCLHVHDNFYNADDHTLPYLGRLNWRKIIQALKKHGYQGDFTFESTNFIRRMPVGLMDEAVAFMVKVGRKMIAGLER